jgi:DNA (cytosine-5)-methyltransferase 1
MVDKRPTVCSVFTGAGGLDIGLEMAGFRTVTAVECDEDCISTLRINQAARIPIPGVEGLCFLEGTCIIAKKIGDVEPGELRPEDALKEGTPDVMAGGPPCQPFSSSGAMLSIADPRGRLFEDFVRLADVLRPRFVLFENVRGLVTAKGPSGEPGEALFMVKEAFEKIGYATRFALLNAADFGCPQRRVRCFMLASRDTEVPLFPEPTHSEKMEGGLFDGLRPWVSLREFLKNQPEPDPADVVRPTARLAVHLGSLKEGTGLRSAGAREATRPGGHWGYRQGTFIADQALPARTVTASASQDWVRLADGTLRRLTWRECAALQGFPRGWLFAGGRASQFRQIGNAVPVVFGRVLGEVLWQAALRSERVTNPPSAPLPTEFTAAINYTKKENRRNGASRSRVIQLQQAGAVNLREIKGIGSAAFQATEETTVQCRELA